MEVSEVEEEKEGESRTKGRRGGEEEKDGRKAEEVERLRLELSDRAVDLPCPSSLPLPSPHHRSLDQKASVFSPPLLWTLSSRLAPSVLFSLPPSRPQLV